MAHATKGRRANWDHRNNINKNIPQHNKKGQNEKCNTAESTTNKDAIHDRKREREIDKREKKKKKKNTHTPTP